MQQDQPDVPSEHLLRLASARRKIRSFLAQIAQLETSEFPHPDAKRALLHIKKVFDDHAERLDKLETKPRPKSVDNACVSVNEDIGTYTSLLGLILRSTNVRNPFEIYYPLKALVRLISKKAQLIISSEWEWSPTTVPLDQVDDMKNFVFIGSPAIECDNVLIAPLAGHEIGHSVWKHLKIADRLKKWVPEPPDDDDAVPADGYTRQVFALVYKQLEEIFCDLAGLYIFSESYIYAVTHALAPGAFDRHMFYPDDCERVDSLVQAATAWNIKYDLSSFDRWRPSEQEFGTDHRLAKADEIVKGVVPKLIKHLPAWLAEKEIDTVDEGTIQAIEKALFEYVPYPHEARLSEILCAGWRVLRRRNGLGRRSDTNKYAQLNEAMLKSVEVAEFKRRIRTAQEKVTADAPKADDLKVEEGQPARRTVLDALKDEILVVPAPDNDALAGASIDLRLGRWFLALRTSSTPAIPLLHGDDLEELRAAGKAIRDGDLGARPTKQTFVPFGDSFVLHPGSFVLGATLEWVRLPKKYSAYVTGKSSLGRHGLVIEAAAGVHPTFSGCLTLELANIGEVPLELFPGMVICQLFPHETTFEPLPDESPFAGRRKPLLGSPGKDPTLQLLIKGERM